MAYFGKHSCVSVELGAQSEPIVLHHVVRHVVFSLSGDQTCSTDVKTKRKSLQLNNVIELGAILFIF